MDEIARRREREERLVSQMIALYCVKRHGSAGGLCPECRELEQYAHQRIGQCPFMREKTFCSNCRVHCYASEKRRKIREVMCFSGPRMLFRHPLTAMRHVAEMNRKAKG